MSHLPSGWRRIWTPGRPVDTGGARPDEAGTPWRQKLLFATRWLVGLGILFLLAWTLDLRAVFEVLGRADPGWLTVGLGLALAARLLQSYQLAAALRHLGMAFSVRRLLAINLIVTFYGLVLPGQLATGVLKWYRISTDGGERAGVLATLVFLRLLNSLVILVLGVFAVLADETLELGGLSWAGLALVGTILAFLALLATDRAGTSLNRWGRSGRPHAGSPWSVLGDALRALRHYRRLPSGEALKLASVPLVALCLSAAVFWAAARALGLGIPLPSLFWLVPLVYFVSLIPATVSGLGLREGALVLLLPHYGVSRPDALAFSLVLFGYVLATGCIGGLLEGRRALWRPLASAGVPAGEGERDF